MHFKDRYDAGKKLAKRLAVYKGEDVVVYAIPRGGVVLGFEIAKALEAPLDVIITRKIGHPFNPEYAICAVAEDGHLLCDEKERATLDVDWLEKEVEKEQQEAKRRRHAYLGEREPVSAKGKIVIVVDDGIATGLTLQLALRELKEHHAPKRLIVAVPVTPKDAVERFKKEVDEFVTLNIPLFYLGAVGAYYDAFGQVEDAEVMRLLEQANGQGVSSH